MRHLFPKCHKKANYSHKKAVDNFNKIFLSSNIDKCLRMRIFVHLYIKCIIDLT